MEELHIIHFPKQGPGKLKDPHKNIHHYVAYGALLPFTSVVTNTGVPDCWKAYLENFHGWLVHSRPDGGRCYMDGKAVSGAVVQKVLGRPLSVLPALLTLPTGKHWLLSDG